MNLPPLSSIIGSLVGVALGLRALDANKPWWARLAFGAAGYALIAEALQRESSFFGFGRGPGKMPVGPQKTGLPSGPSSTNLKFEERKARTIDERVSFVHEQSVKGTRDPKVYTLAREVLARKCGDSWCVREKDALGEITALFDEVKKKVRYTWDPLDYDAFQTPAKTLELQTGDCDDYMSLLGAMLRSVGYKIRSRVVQTKGQQTWNHIYLLAFVPTESRWMPLDLSVQKPAGWEVPREYIVRVKDFDVVEGGSSPQLPSLTRV